jgi:hypothetical protein
MPIYPASDSKAVYALLSEASNCLGFYNNVKHCCCKTVPGKSISTLLLKARQKLPWQLAFTTFTDYALHSRKSYLL